MNVNFGLFPPPEIPERQPGQKKVKGRDRKSLYSERALADLDLWLGRRAAA